MWPGCAPSHSTLSGDVVLVSQIPELAELAEEDPAPVLVQLRLSR
jgi:hypothetical protein